MGALTISDLTPIDGEPTVEHGRIAAALGYGEARAVRRLIDRNADELLMHGGLCQVSTNPGAQGGRPSQNYYLNEAQALLVCMFARTEKAAAVRKQVIDVFLAWRRGELTTADRTVEVLNRLEARLSALEATGQTMRRIVAEPAEAATALTHAVDLWATQTRQRRPKFWGDLDVRGLVLATHRQMTLDEAMALITARVGEDRAPSRSSVHRFWTVLDRLRGTYPSVRSH